MTSKERVLKTINFEKTDRLALWDVHHYGSFNDNWRKYLDLEEDAEPRTYYGYDTTGYTSNECFFPSEKKMLSEDAEFTIENDGFGRILRRKKNGYFPDVLDYKLKNKRDIDKLEFESASMNERFEDVDEFIEKEKNYCMFAKTGGIYIRSHSLWPEDQLLMDMILEPQFCRELFGKVADHMTAMSIETLRRTNTWDTGLWVYDDMASTFSPMFSPDLFEKYLLPLYKSMIKKCKQAGCSNFFFHSDGNILPLLDMLLDAGFTGFNPLEPRSGLNLVSLREKYSKKMVLFGGICNTEILPRGNKKEIREHVLPLIELAADGGVVLGTASVAEDVSPEAFDFCMSLIKTNLE